MAQVLNWLGQGQQRFQRGLIAAVMAPLPAFLVDFNLGLGAGTMVVEVGIEVFGIKAMNGLRVFAGDVAVAHVLADDGAILAFHQPVVVAVAGPAFGLLDQQLVQQSGHGLVDELAAVVGVKATNAEGKLAEQGGQHRLQVGLADALASGHDLPLGDFIDGALMW